MDRTMLYDVLYALAARDGREASLFGTCAPAAHEAFSRALTGNEFPELWFELPLSGEPWFDVHVLVSHADVAGTEARFAGHGGRYADALRWFAQRTEGVRQLALSYDSHTGNVENPAVQLLADRRGSDVVRGFLTAAGRPEALQAFRDFCTRMPDSWYACYTGVFPEGSRGAAAPFLRMECIVGAELQDHYAKNPSMLGDHLADVGAPWVTDELLSYCQHLAASPFPLEFQFDVCEDGTAGATFSASLRFGVDTWTQPQARLELVRLMRLAREWGVADDRWMMLADAIFSKKISHGGASLTAYCYPAFLKLRWREGILLDAKAYLISRADQ